MKLKLLKLKNFRGYREELEIDFNDLTAFIGKNDVGKSTVLEALDIFFNDGKGVIKIDKEDLNNRALEDRETEICITAVMDELPDTIVIDATNETTLQNEYLLNRDGFLEITKKYQNGGKAKVYVRANHPENKNCSDLLCKTNSELKATVKSYQISCENQRVNANLRRSIWNHFNAGQDLKEVEIDVSKGDAKEIWGKLENYLPMYSLFQSDRKNDDGDSEVQDPLKEAVKQKFNDADLKRKFEEITLEVKKYLDDVADRTLKKLQEMNSDLAKSLVPVLPSAESLKWADVFKNVSIAGGDGIPINKRGSGVKRLILLNFFRAEAERRKNLNQVPSIIYAIEEPETSQHFDHQKNLIDAFKELSKSQNTQIILTTHSSVIVKEMAFDQLRLVKSEGDTLSIQKVSGDILTYPSLNEVNYLAFSEFDTEYFNELYSQIVIKGQLSEFEKGKTKLPYLKLNDDGSTLPKCYTQDTIIRHQIHHPENKHNEPYSQKDLKASIERMRDFISDN